MRKTIRLPQKISLRICKLYSLFTLAQPQKPQAPWLSCSAHRPVFTIDLIYCIE